MQSALESLFGPAAGLIGLAVMAIMLVPKFVVRWRGFRQRKRESSERRANVAQGSRVVLLSAQSSARGLSDHPTHGEPIARFSSARAVVIATASLCMLPFIAVLLFSPSGQLNLRIILLIITIPIGFMGLFSCTHLGDTLTFYKSGVVGKLGLKRIDLDYNSIVSYVERSALIPFRPPSMIARLDDDQLIVFDGNHFIAGEKIRDIFTHLDKRVIRCAADEQKRLSQI